MTLRRRFYKRSFFKSSIFHYGVLLLFILILLPSLIDSAKKTIYAWRIDRVHTNKLIETSQHNASIMAEIENLKNPFSREQKIRDYLNISGEGEKLILIYEKERKNGDNKPKTFPKDSTYSFDVSF
ncbi:MAG: hypothetical protein OXU73_01580 [Candidatus Campbellbacteria bacterium]|nr:hypothetical protein [Candidatus Campbellbacteria bacterium]